MLFPRAETSFALVLVVAGLISLVGCQRPPTPTEIAAIESSLPEQINYNWHVRPILSNNCFRCHGNDAAKRKAGLRLDEEESAYGPVPEDKSKRAIVPGKPWSSEAIVRILSEDQDKRMPPLDSHKTLTAQEKGILFRWVEQGGKYEQHWAYIPPSVARPAKSPFDKQAVNEVDKYVYAGLKTNGLAPSPEADRETLINRVTL
ncbi:MAG: c-type cytochrome domain-containing protein, partial [Pseudomonadota bacterium]